MSRFRHRYPAAGVPQGWQRPRQTRQRSCTVQPDGRSTPGHGPCGTESSGHLTGNTARPICPTDGRSSGHRIQRLSGRVSGQPAVTASPWPRLYGHHSSFHLTTGPLPRLHPAKTRSTADTHQDTDVFRVASIQQPGDIAPHAWKCATVSWNAACHVERFHHPATTLDSGQRPAPPAGESPDTGPLWLHRRCGHPSVYR
jgi:hypothetical protein